MQLYAFFWVIHTNPPLKMEQTVFSETLAFKLQTPVNHPEESIQHSEHGESLKSRRYAVLWNSFAYLGTLFKKHGFEELIPVEMRSKVWICTRSIAEILVRVPLAALVFVFVFVVRCVGSVSCDELIAHSVESYRVYECVTKIFRTGAAIYTAAVVARSTGRWYDYRV
jgi:hypothetical protein